MAMDFPSAGARASGGDLAVQISPLGMVELSDEEFLLRGSRSPNGSLCERGCVLPRSPMDVPQSRW